MDKDYMLSLGDLYLDAMEEMDTRLPKSLFEEMVITTFVDSDHAHNKITRRSVMGLLIFVGKMLVCFLCKRQGAVEMSTYSAKFCTMQTAVEEVMSIQYML